MAGIDNITNEILQEAKDAAAGVTGEASKKAEELLAKAREEGEALKAKAEEKAKSDAEGYASRIVSQSALRKRQAVLKEKQAIISEVIEAAYKKLDTQPDGEYFSMLLGLVASHLRQGEGELLLSGRDAARLPADFGSKVSELANKAGAKLTLSGEPADIDNGFILRYGGIEENCSLKALFQEQADALSDKVAEVLWLKENTDG